MQPLLQILENLVLLTFLGLGYYVIENARPNLTSFITSVLHGVCFGLVAFLVTSTPVSMGDGATVDARAGPVILAGAIAGPVAATIAAVLGGLARGLIGGSFAFSGMVVYLVYAAIGTVFWLCRHRIKMDFLNPAVILVLTLASWAGASAMYFIIQPAERANAWLVNDLPYIFIANSLSITFAAIAIGIALAVATRAVEAATMTETLRLAKRASNFGIWDFDVKSGKLTWDRRSKELHGISDDDFAGTFDDWARNVHPDDLGQTQDAFARSIENSNSFDAEYRVIHPDGTQKVIKGDALFLRDSAGEAVRVVGTNIDLTEIRATEEELRETQMVALQAQKFDTIGQLTGGVAHDFNNLLAVIMGNLELATDEIGRDAPDKQEVLTLLEASLEATRRGAELTQNMLSYARKARLTPERLDLNGIVRETESWMRRTIPSRIEIETNLQAGLWQTRADRSSLQSALVNLLVNARDSIEGSGQVTIETGNLRVDEDYIASHREDIRPGRYVMLAVSDTGRGIDPRILGRIFDPFFTTKRVGEGSGLGLSMVQGFVKQSGGAIRVYSEPGVGTSFKMYFPVTSDKPVEPPGPRPHEEAFTQQAKAGQRILLVEDRKEVLQVLSKTLQAAGYEVVTASSGDDGFEIFSRMGGVDLVITDIVMPGRLQGPAMAREIRRLDPEMNFVFLSGYASEATVHGNGVRAEDVRLMKPVSRSALLDAVRRCLATPRTSSEDS